MARKMSRQLVLLSRTLHIYLSMLALLTILFFGATGFLLNHPTWFNLEKTAMAKREGVVPDDIAAAEDKLTLVEYLRDKEGARGSVKSYSKLDDRTEVNFTGPGRTTQYTVYPTGDLRVRMETRNGLAWLTDLHKAKYTGRAWPLVVDVTAWLLILVSITGLILWITLAKRRTIGLIAVGASVVVIVVVLTVLMP